MFIHLQGFCFRDPVSLQVIRFTDFSESCFAGSEIPDPVNLTNAFALHTLVLAELKLLEAALLDERNQKFVLLSESCIPIHPPEVVYAQVPLQNLSVLSKTVLGPS